MAEISKIISRCFLITHTWFVVKLLNSRNRQSDETMYSGFQSVIVYNLTNTLARTCTHQITRFKREYPRQKFNQCADRALHVFCVSGLAEHSVYSQVQTESR